MAEIQPGTPRAPRTPSPTTALEGQARAAWDEVTDKFANDLWDETCRNEARINRRSDSDDLQVTSGMVHDADRALRLGMPRKKNVRRSVALAAFTAVMGVLTGVLWNNLDNLWCALGAIVTTALLVVAVTFQVIGEDS